MLLYPRLDLYHWLWQLSQHAPCLDSPVKMCTLLTCAPYFTLADESPCTCTYRAHHHLHIT
jgi:hypothetical protein